MMRENSFPNLPMEIILDIIDYLIPEEKWILSHLEVFSWVREKYNLENYFKDNNEFILKYAAEMGSVPLLEWGSELGYTWFYETVNRAKIRVDINFLNELGKYPSYRQDANFYLEDALSYLQYYLGLISKKELICIQMS